MRGLGWSLVPFLALACNSERAQPTESTPSASVGPSRQTRPSPKIELSKVGIDRVTLDSSAGDEVVLEKQKDGWRVLAPKPEGPADSESVERLLSDLEGIEFVQVMEVAKHPELGLHIVAAQGKKKVFGARLGSRVDPVQQLLVLESDGELWLVRRIPPWMLWATDKDFRKKT